MAEVQTTTQSGELTQRFIEFIMMHAQNAALFLGQIPNPQTGEGEVNLDLAKMFIDQLAMIQEKTRGNLSKEEEAVLRNTISNLQMAFVEVSQGGGGTSSRSSADVQKQSDGGTSSDSSADVQKHDDGGTSSDSSADVQKHVPPADAPGESAPSPNEGDSRKKFTKSYGA